MKCHGLPRGTLQDSMHVGRSVFPQASKAVRFNQQPAIHLAHPAHHWPLLCLVCDLAALHRLKEAPELQDAASGLVELRRMLGRDSKQ